MKTKDQSVAAIFKDLAKPGLPGVSLAVAKDGQIVHQQCIGLASLELGVPITPETVFNIGSVSKQFTAFAVALLEQDGKLQLDDDIREYFPEMHDFDATVTLGHLIHHTSGMPNSYVDLLMLAGWRDGDVTTQQDALNLIIAQRGLNFIPGEEFQYSNANYVLLAEMCRRVSGQSFSQFCRERIFEPLGMTSTLINDSIFKIIPHRASGYYRDKKGVCNIAPLHDSILGSTNIYTNPDDLAKWLHNFETGQVGGMELIRRVKEPGALNNGTRIGYAFGLDVGPTHIHRGWQVVEHSGTHGGYVSHAMHFPEQNLSVNMMFNVFRFDMPSRARDVADLFLPGEHPGKAQNPETKKPIRLESSQLTQWTGLYYNDSRGALRKVTCRKGNLLYETAKVTPFAPGKFFFEHELGYELDFWQNKDGTNHACLITPNGLYDYDQVQPVDARKIDPSGYAGEYYSLELDARWFIQKQRNALIIKRRRYPDSHPLPVFKDVFSDDWQLIADFPLSFLLIFKRDAQGAVTGFRVSGSGVCNVEFIKN